MGQVVGEFLKGFESGLRAELFGGCDGAVEGHNRVRSVPKELVVEGDDLGPVGGCVGGSVGVDGSDGGLDVEGARLVTTKAGPDEIVSFGDQLLIPECAQIGESLIRRR